jgi:hypothetical protein
MTLPIFAVAESERAAGMLAQNASISVYKALAEQGVAILRGLFPPAMIDTLHGEFAARFGNFDGAAMEAMSQRPPPNPIQKNGDGRFEMVMRMSGGFGPPLLFANPILLRLLKPMLGGDLMRLASMTAVASFPGAQQQHVHRDGTTLFGEFPNIDPALPPYAITAAIPLIDVDPAIGPTGFWPGSHRWPAGRATQGPMLSVPFQRGDCLLVDYRTIHAGMANNSRTVRPILYMVYSREWFYDDVNHRQRSPLEIAADDLQAMPPELQQLMLRARKHAVARLSSLP